MVVALAVDASIIAGPPIMASGMTIVSYTVDATIAAVFFSEVGQPIVLLYAPIDGAAGELFVYELLSSLLEDFGPSAGKA